MSDRMYDKDLRERLCTELQRFIPHATLKREVTIGKTRADVVMMTTSLFGYEIKGDTDPVHCQHFKDQVAEYDKVFDYCSLVVSNNGGKAKAALKVLPPHWGLFVIGAGVECHQLAELNPNQDPIALADQLWKSEVVRLLKRRKVQIPSRFTKDRVCKMVSENYSVDDLRAEVIATWTHRKVNIDERFRP